MAIIVYLINGIFLQLVDYMFCNDRGVVEGYNYVTKIKCTIFTRHIVYIDYFNTTLELDQFIEKINAGVHNRITPVTLKIPRKDA